MISLQRISALSLAAVLLWNCESKTPPMEYMPDMADSIAREAQEADAHFPNNQAVRLPPVGAVPVGYYPYEYKNWDKALDQLPNKGLANPFKGDLATLKRGEDKYQTYCSPCHGVRGQGNGPVVGPAPRLNAVQADGSPMAALTSAVAKGYSDGQIYHIITEGKGRMNSYASQVTPEDRWKIILYVRKLQEYDNKTNKGTATK
ncbi:cytochrome c [Leptospira langatensis]|uniref:Cytochrome c n=1 Tax=Leptospira langatensis TaxID=2484983 RepID=A0A5F1ZRP7_9LEPT|nr:cytochrome c [Leptospira langatensis]TGJ98980.1 cytochrome c [Leptospira langatensis]TGL40452.1 cytochrome c [Leptospira langatensis]